MATNALLFVPIPFPEVQARLPRRHIRNALRRFATKMAREFKKTVKTWNRKPKFAKKTSFKKGIASVTVGTDDRIYGFLDEGTDERWALMSQDFVAKTKTGWIGSSSGAGHVVVRGGLMQKLGLPAQPGIEARLWGETITKQMRPGFLEVMQIATQAAILEATGLGLVR